MKTQTIDLGGNAPIVIQIDNDGSGTLSSIGLKEACPNCGSETCHRTCPEQNEFQDSDRELEKEGRLVYNAAIDGMESLLLALACEGVDVTGPAFGKAVLTVLDKLGNE